jgi:outer membrane protein TolC
MRHFWVFLVLFLPLGLIAQQINTVGADTIKKPNVRVENDVIVIDSLSVFDVFDFSIEIFRQLPNLDTLFLIAKAYSPMVNKNIEFHQAQLQKIKLERRRYWKHVSLFGNYSQGNQGLIVPGADVATLFEGYRYGINIQFPLEEIFTRRARTKLAQHEAQAFVHIQEEMEVLLHRDMVRLYNQMIKSQRQMNIHREFLERARINERVAERQYRENQMRLMDYTRISEIRTLAENRYEDVSADFFIAFFELEVLIGQPLYLLKK